MLKPGTGSRTHTKKRLILLILSLDLAVCCLLGICRLKTEQEMFCETIALALGLSAQDMMEFQHAYDKDKANQSRLLKAKFSMFNTGMDAFLAQQGEWRVSSAALRDVLAQQLTQRILSTYATFFATYSAIKFSKKHMNEYLKYTPAQLELHLRSFFGRST